MRGAACAAHEASVFASAVTFYAVFRAMLRCQDPRGPSCALRRSVALVGATLLECGGCRVRGYIAAEKR